MSRLEPLAVADDAVGYVREVAACVHTDRVADRPLAYSKRNKRPGGRLFTWYPHGESNPGLQTENLAS